MTQTLKEQFEAMMLEEAGNYDQAELDLFLKNSEILIKSGLGENALQAGDQFPSFALPDANGEIIRSEDLLAKGALVVNFYRGAWCPYCQIELRAHRDRLDEMKALGAQLIAVTPERPDLSMTVKERENIEFPVLTDETQSLSEDLGIVFELPESLHQFYADDNADLSLRNADGTWRLPIPATYVVAPDGRIVFAYVEANYMERLEPQVVIDQLKSMQ